MKKVLDLFRCPHPRVESLEDRLPPGEWFLGTTFGISLVDREFLTRPEPTPSEALVGEWISPENQGSRSALLAAQSREGEPPHAVPQDPAPTAWMELAVRDLIESGASVLPTVSHPLAADVRPASVGEFLPSNVPAVSFVAPAGSGQMHENRLGTIPPFTANSTSLNSAALAALSALRKGGPAGPHGGNDQLTFEFVDRPDARADENYGLVPDTFGSASGLLVTFDVSQGQLANPLVINAPSGCPDPATEVIGKNAVLVDFGQACTLPVSPGAPGDVDNQVTLQVDADPAAKVTPTEITWLAPIHNVVPRRLSSETNFDSEPSLAVNPVGGTLALTTFSGSWSPGRGAPLWVSGDGGLTWDQRFGIPQPESGAFGPADQTMAYNADGSLLYGTFLGGGGHGLGAYVRTTPDPLTADFAGNYVFSGSPGPDQPWIQVGPVDADTGLDRVYLSVNDGDHYPASASVLVSSDGGASFQAPARLERGTGVFSDHPPRVAVSGDRVYGAFLRRTGTPIGVEGPGEVVVVRDDRGGIRGPANPDPFSVLDQGVVLQSGSYPTAGFLLGQQRIGGDLSLAIDPHDSDTVYLSFSRIENHLPVLYVHRSQDGGQSWQDLLSINNAAIGNLAVADNGTWGLSNIRVANGRMFQEFRQNGGEPTVLTSWPVNDPRGGVVYVGDYQSFVVVGNTFYEGFCASNFPDLADFPPGVVYQRNADFPGHHLLTADGGPVAHTIDPFFFSQDASDPGAHADKRR